MNPRDRLDAERRRTVERLERLGHDHDAFVEASRNSNADDEHDPEGTTIAFERSQVETLVRRLRRHLADLDVADERVAAGTYGRCQVCGRAIPAARLDARPAALTCVGCAP